MKRPAIEPTCIGCGCTDRRACRGGCSWARPGLCSACDGKDVLKPTPIVVEIVNSAIQKALAVGGGGARARSGRRVPCSCSVPSLAMLALFGDSHQIDTDRRCRLSGYALRPTTRLSMGATGVWCFSLVWHRRGKDSLNFTETHRLRIDMGKAFAYGVKRRRR